MIHNPFTSRLITTELSVDFTGQGTLEEFLLNLKRTQVPPSIADFGPADEHNTKIYVQYFPKEISIDGVVEYFRKNGLRVMP